MQRKHYTEEEKNAIMSRYAAGGEEVRQMLAEYGVPKSTFNQWLREYDIKFGCSSKYDFTPRNFRSILRRNDHLEDLLAVLNDSYCSPNASLNERLLEAERLYKNYNVHAWKEDYTSGNLKESTLAVYERLLKRNFNQFYGKRLKDIKHRDVQHWVNTLTNNGLSPKSVKNNYSLLRSILRTAVEWEYLDKNPADNIRLPKMNHKE